jgi:hypothetical protein
MLQRMVVGLVAIGLGAGSADAQYFKRKQPHADGTRVTVTGAVTDAEGRPVADLRVQLRASRREMNYKKLRREENNPVVKSATTDAAGQYTIDWTWHRYYNHFVLEALVPVRRPRGKIEQRVLAELDLSQRMGSTPVVAPLTISDTGFLERLRAFEASIANDAQRRIYEQQGKPDKVDVISAVEHEEETWWYFGTGTLFRFEDDALVEVENFEPIVGFEQGSS